MLKFSFILFAIVCFAQVSRAGQTGSTQKYQGPALSAEEQDRLNTLLLEAATEGHLYEINRLMRQGAEVDAQDDLGNTPLMLATSFGHYDAMKALLAWSANANAQNDAGDTALTLLAQYGVNEDTQYAADQMVTLLVQQGGANPYQGDRDFNLPVTIARQQGNIDVANGLARLTDKMERLAIDEEMTELEPRKKKRRYNHLTVTCQDEVFNLGHNNNNDKDDDDLRNVVRPFPYASSALDW